MAASNVKTPVDHRAPDGTLVLTEKELNDTFTEMERDYVVKPLIDSGRVRIIPAPAPQGGNC